MHVRQMLNQITDAVLDVYAPKGLADFTTTWAFVASYNNMVDWDKQNGFIVSYNCLNKCPKCIMVLFFF